MIKKEIIKYKHSNNIYDDIKLDDDRFEVLICNLKNEKELVKSLLDLKNRGIVNKKGFTFYRTNDISIIFHKKIPKIISI